MRCTNHPARESASYCPGCGDFFCGTCLATCEDGKNYCPSCRTRLDKRPKVYGVRSEDRLATKVLVRYRSGAEAYGTTYKIDPDRTGFSFIVHTPKGPGEERYVDFADVKYVALVSSFHGEKAETVREYQPKGSEVSVTFKDGEVLKGFTLKHYDDKDPRFSVIPAAPGDNRISVIVERGAVAHMALGRIPKTQELRKLIDTSMKRLIMHFYWRHPDVLITVSELASRLGRTGAAIDRELDDFLQEGFIQRIGPPSAGQIKFIPPKDPVVRQTVAALGKEIDQLYFRAKPQPEKPEPGPIRPAKPAIRWPL